MKRNRLLDEGRFSTVIRVGLRERFAKEPDKGTLVNDLLEKHYKEKKWKA